MQTPNTELNQDAEPLDTEGAEGPADPKPQGWFGRRLRIALPPLAAFAVTLLLWEGYSRVFDVATFVLPRPLQVAERFVAEGSTITPNALVTMSEAVGGFAIGLGIGVLLAILFVRFEWLEKSLYPYALASQTIPIVAIAPLLIIWFGFGRTSKVVVAALLAFFPILVNTVIGLRSVDPEAMNLYKSYGASEARILFSLRMPTALPHLFTGMKIAAPLSVTGAVVGEFVGAFEGVGYLITQAQFYLDAEMTFAVILATSLLAIGFFLVVAILERFVVFWNYRQ